MTTSIPSPQGLDQDLTLGSTAAKPQREQPDDCKRSQLTVFEHVQFQAWLKDVGSRW